MTTRHLLLYGFLVGLFGVTCTGPRTWAAAPGSYLTGTSGPSTPEERAKYLPPPLTLVAGGGA